MLPISVGRPSKTLFPKMIIGPLKYWCTSLFAFIVLPGKTVCICLLCCSIFSPTLVLVHVFMQCLWFIRDVWRYTNVLWLIDWCIYYSVRRFVFELLLKFSLILSTYVIKIQWRDMVGGGWGSGCPEPRIASELSKGVHVNVKIWWESGLSGRLFFLCRGPLYFVL